jgi:hypothetical protein
MELYRVFIEFLDLKSCVMPNGPLIYSYYLRSFNALQHLYSLRHLLSVYQIVGVFLLLSTKAIRRGGRIKSNLKTNRCQITQEPPKWVHGKKNKGYREYHIWTVTLRITIRILKINRLSHAVNQKQNRPEFMLPRLWDLLLIVCNSKQISLQPIKTFQGDQLLRRNRLQSYFSISMDLSKIYRT